MVGNAWASPFRWMPPHQNGDIALTHLVNTAISESGLIGFCSMQYLLAIRIHLEPR